MTTVSGHPAPALVEEGEADHGVRIVLRHRFLVPDGGLGIVWRDALTG